jgi:hypothetical protein
MEDDDASIFFSNVSIEMVNSYTTDIGGIYVDGESTVIVKDHEWWFDSQGSLTVDGVTLWTDRAGASASSGLGIKFPDPESSYYSSVSSGTIKMMSASADFSVLQDLVISNSIAINQNHDLTISNSIAINQINDLVISNSIAINQCDCDGGGGGDDDDHLFVGEKLQFSINQTFDGAGRHYVFSHGSDPQFIIDAGVTLVIKNLELLRINENTFSMGDGAKLQIGENVLFELAEDVIWDQGKIQLIGSGNTFTIRGMDCCRKKFCFKKPCFKNDIILDLGTNTMRLECIELCGLHLFDGHTKMRDRNFAINGSITLGCNAIVDVLYSTKMNFIVDGCCNELRLFNNNIGFEGELTFGNEPENDLHIQFILVDSLATPRVNFEKQFMFVTSNNGIARLIFDDPYVQVYNEGSSSFVVGKNSFLGGRILEILNNPIKQISPYFAIDAGLVLTGDMDSVIVQELTRSIWNPGVGYDLIIKNNTVKLSAAKNDIKVDSGTITDFGVSGDQALSLSLFNGSTVKQKSSDVIVKTNDTISVYGTENKIVVKEKLTINGTLSISDQSELTFLFSDEGGTPEVHFASSTNKILSIGKGARLKFSGGGRVTFDNGYAIVFDGTISGKTSELMIESFAELTLGTSAVIYMTGTGKISLEQNGRIYVASNQNLIVGQNSSDSLEFALNREGEIEVDGAFSMQLASYALNFMRESRLSVGSGGLFEINSFDEQEVRGLLSQFTFQNDSVLKIVSGGSLVIGRNKNNISGTETPFTWNNSDGVIVVGGQVGFVGSSIAGTLQNNLSGPVSIGAQSLVGSLINTMTTLSVTILFQDSSGNQKILTKDGVVVDLLSGDQVVGDDASSGMVSIVNGGELFQITPQGERF